MDKLTIVSIALNMILATLFFFKSALNDIFKKWWDEKEQQKKDFRNHLIELRKKVMRIQNWSSITLITLASFRHGTDPAAKVAMKASYEELIQKMGEVNQYILDNEIYYPEGIRKLYKEYNEKFGKALTETITSVMYKERFIEIMKGINPILEALLTKVENHLSKS